MKIRYLSTLVFLCLGSLLQGQQLLKGIVIDENKEPLAFVNILINGDFSKGVSTDIEGKFEVPNAAAVQTLDLSYVGYEKMTYQITDEDFKDLLVLKLKPITADLPEATIIAGENPAHRIIRKAVENREQNNPEKMEAFQCETYNKMVFEWMPNEKEFNKYLEEKADTSKKNLVQTRIKNFKKMVKGAEERHLFMMESVTERKYKSPERNNEKILYNRVSGLKHPSFSALANDVQPFSFYQPYLEILGKAFLNPISPGSTKKYFFNIEDTLFQNQDTVFIISYHPRKGKNFEGLKGLLYIHTAGYAIQSVIAKPYDKSFINMKIEQRYVKVEEEQWFPEQLNFVMEATKYPHKLIGMRVSGKSYIDKVQLHPNLSKKDFKERGAVTEKNANTRTDSIWQKYRPQVLTEKEARTYTFMDSLGAKKHFDTYLNLLESLASGRYPLGPFDLLLTKVLAFNEYEGTRTGLGLSTNDRISRYFELGGYAGYGLKDKAWKYGAYLQLKLIANNRLNLRFDYQDDIIEPASPNFSTEPTIFTSRLFLNRMDSRKSQSLRLYGKLMSGVYFNTSFSKSRWEPNYSYNLRDYDITISEFNFAEFGVDLRFSFREKIVRFMGTEVTETKYPQIFFSYQQGFPDLFDGEYDFKKVLIAVEDDMRIRNLGETSFRIESGWTEGLLPYNRLFGNSGIGRGFQWLEIDHTFQTMDQFEFLSDRFVHLFFAHNFESHLLKFKNWKPEISVVQHIGFGSLADPNIHGGIDFKTMEKGYYEAGLRVDNLYRLNYVNLLYLGIGAGVYYRYGPYSLEETADNFAYRFRLQFSF